ncbi:MAG: type II secretion system protein, partial [Bacilli bacterium]
MRKRIKQKGFSLIELLAVCVILGIIFTIVVILNNSIGNKIQKTYYEKQMSLIIISAKEYYSNNIRLLPKEIGAQSTVLLKDLVSQDYLKPIYSYKKKPCDLNSNDLKVSVTKMNNKEYQYSIYFICDGFEKSIDKTAPIIKFTPNKNLITNKDIKVIATATDEKEGSGILKIEWIIYKNNAIFINSTDTTGKLKQNLTDEGTYFIQASAYDREGNRSTIKSPIYIIDKSSVNIPKLTNPITEFTNKNINISVESAINAIKTECKTASTAYVSCNKTYTVKQNTVVYARSYDKAGNVSEIASLYVGNIDKTLPTVSFNLIINNRDNKIVQINASDNLSGIKQIRYRISPNGGTGWTNWSNYIYSTETSVNLEMVGQNLIQVEITDMATNIAYVMSSAYLIEDITPPIKPILINPITQYTNSNINIKVEKAYDAIRNECRTASTNYVSCSNTFNVSANTTIYARSYDKAGNVS